LIARAACEGTVKIAAKALKFAGADLADLGIAVKLGLDGAALTDGHIMLPGHARLSATGQLPRPGKPGSALFDGAINFDAAEPALFLGWLGVPTEHVQPNALKVLKLSGPFRLEDRARVGAANGAGGERYLTPHLDRETLTLDDQSFTLSAAYDERAPGYLLFALEGQKLDADAYGLGLFWPRAPLETKSWARTLWGRAARAGEVNIALTLGELKTAGRTLRGLEAAMTRGPDGQAAATASIADLASYQISLAGTRQKTNGDHPGAENAQLNVSRSGAGIHLPFAGKPLQGALKLDVALAQAGDRADWKLGGSIGTIKLQGEGTGPASEQLIPDIERLSVSAKFDRGTAILGGSLRGLTAAPAFAGNLTVDAQDFPSFMRELGFTYDPRRKDLGALALVAHGVASLDHVGIDASSVSVGEDSLTAQADLNLLAKRPVLKAEIKAEKISADGYLPAPDKAATWSSERLKLDLLRRFDGEIRFTADRLEIGPWDMRKVQALIPITDGTISTRNATATIYGGPATFTGNGHLSEAGIDVGFDMLVQDFDWTIAAARLFPALGAEGPGNANAHLAGNARGQSMMALVGSFSGRTNVSGSAGTLKGFDLAAWGAGLKDARGPDVMARLSKLLTQGASTVSAFNINAAGANGTLAITDGNISLGGGEAALSGAILLPPRTLSLRLALTPAAAPQLAPTAILISGPIALPTPKIDLQDLAVPAGKS
jgi:hypothetical protein